MNTVRADQVTARAGEPVSIAISVTDQDGDAVTVAGAAADFKIARTRWGTALLSKDEADGITLSGSTATVAFDTADVLGDDDEQLYGDFFFACSVTKSGDLLYVAEGILTIMPVPA